MWREQRKSPSEIEEEFIRCTIRLILCHSFCAKALSIHSFLLCLTEEAQHDVSEGQTMKTSTSAQ